MTELLNKQVLKINTINDEPIIDLSISNKIPDSILDKNFIDILNKYKNMINNIQNIKTWDFCKKLSNPFELLHHYIKNKNINLGIANYDPISRSFFKLWEIIYDFDLIEVDNKNIVYGALAEGPGGFIEAFNFYRRKNCQNSQDTINCITLKSYSNHIPGWNKSNRLFKECSNYTISWGIDDTGDLYNLDNILYFSKLFKNKKADLVTGDGGFDFSMDYCNQEQDAIRLILCEIITGFTILKNNGNMVIKVFDIFHNATIDIIYILSYYFNELYIVKPYTSRSANSEKYLVCKKFKGISDTSLEQFYSIVKDYSIIDDQHKYITRILKNKIPDNFTKMIMNMNINYTSNQIKAILKALAYSKLSMTNNDINCIKNEQTIYSLSWCYKYKFPINNKCKYFNKYNPYNYIPNF